MGHDLTQVEKVMGYDAYRSLAQALDALPGGFPATKSGVELRILQKIFQPEEARFAACLGRTSETAGEIAARVGLTEEEVYPMLRAIASKGLVLVLGRADSPRYRLAPFVVGFYEEQWQTMDHEMAHLFSEYWEHGAGEAIMKYQPALQRVVPARSALKTDLILPYDDVRPLVEAATSFELRDCICRKNKELRGKRSCGFPLATCLGFSPVQRPETSTSIHKDQALSVLDRAEEIGLVHSVSNVAKGVFYICNCCGCCCEILGGITRLGIDGSMAKANYLAVVDESACTGCGLCQDRCQVQACSVSGAAKVDQGKCIGCGLCVTGCPDKAILLQLKPACDIVPPPENYKAWEQLRLQIRGRA